MSSNASCLIYELDPSNLLGYGAHWSVPTAAAAAVAAAAILVIASCIGGIGIFALGKRNRPQRQEQGVSTGKMSSDVTTSNGSAAKHNKDRKITYAEFRAMSASATGINGEKFGTAASTSDTRTSSSDSTGQSTESKPLWIAINAKIYDISTFASTHPGGNVIYSMVGRDATDVFLAFHMPRVQKRLGSKSVPCVGVLVDAPEVKPATRDYRNLREKLWKEGWFECSLLYQSGRDAIAAGILALGLVAIWYGTAPLIRVILGGTAVGISLQQVAFTAHDSGHRAVTHPQSGGSFNWWGWFHGTVCFGVSSEMWLYEHSMHHALTMEPHEDPQFNYLPVWLVSQKELMAFRNKSGIDRALARILVPVQHVTMIPLSMIIGRFNLHAISIGWCIKHLRSRQMILMMELAGFLLYFGWFGYVVSLLPPADAATAAAVQDGASSTSSSYFSWIPTFLTGERFWFVMVSYVTAGLLHIQLTISHLALEAFTADDQESEQFIYHQMKTTRNINTTKWDEWFHGGLQYQIEHHLFPQLPRHNLAKVKPMVEDLCKKHDIKYELVGFCYAVWYCLKDFKRLANIFMGHIEG